MTADPLRGKNLSSVPSRILPGVTRLIGNTPILCLSAFSAARQLEQPLWAKIEFLNPGGSVKDRVALAMVEDAERSGRLNPGGTLIEPTSGNTGIGLALVAAAKGYRLILTMPDTMSMERRKLIQAYGAECVLTPGREGMQGAVEKAYELCREISGSVLLQQFENPSNPEIHEKTTGEEIWKDTEGQVDFFVAGVGTGGTLSGVGAFLKSKKPSVNIIGVEPAESPVLSGGEAGMHKIQGIGANFIPVNFHREVADEIIRVPGDEAFRECRDLACREGLLTGISSGAALHAAIQIGLRRGNQNKKIVVLLPDNGERYLSTLLYATDEYPLS